MSIIVKIIGWFVDKTVATDIPAHRLHDALLGEDRRMNRSWNTDSNWR